MSQEEPTLKEFLVVNVIPKFIIFGQDPSNFDKLMDVSNALATVTNKHYRNQEYDPSNTYWGNIARLEFEYVTARGIQRVFDKMYYHFGESGVNNEDLIGKHMYQLCQQLLNTLHVRSRHMTFRFWNTGVVFKGIPVV